MIQNTLIDQEGKTIFTRHVCPFCQKEIYLKYSRRSHCLKERENGSGLTAILNIHGDPIHALILYVDSLMNVRSHSVIENIEVSRDSDTLKQLLNAWSKVS